MRIVFHGKNAAAFSEGFSTLIGEGNEIVILPDILASSADREAFADADIIIGTRFDAALPRPRSLKLFHVPGAGYDSVDLDALPVGVVVCNCFGHEHAIAEYVMAALLRRHVPLMDADRHLREGDWRYSASLPGQVHREMAGSSIGILGFGHIGKAVAVRAKAFGMVVHVANRSAVSSSDVDKAYNLADLTEFWGNAEFIVVTLPLVAETRGIVGADAFARMRKDAVLINVARGPIVDERVLYDALLGNRIAGAVIDTWYQYPTPDEPHCLPSKLLFHELANVLMTPHMSGWTNGTIRRRQQVIADNIRLRVKGGSCINVVRS